MSLRVNVRDGTATLRTAGGAPDFEAVARRLDGAGFTLGPLLSVRARAGKEGRSALELLLRPLEEDPERAARLEVRGGEPGARIVLWREDGGRIAARRLDASGRLALALPPDLEAGQRITVGRGPEDPEPFRLRVPGGRVRAGR